LRDSARMAVRVRVGIGVVYQHIVSSGEARRIAFNAAGMTVFDIPVECSVPVHVTASKESPCQIPIACLRVQHSPFIVSDGLCCIRCLDKRLHKVVGDVQFSAEVFESLQVALEQFKIFRGTCRNIMRRSSAS